jgi:hypothetical protein
MFFKTILWSRNPTLLGIYTSEGNEINMLKRHLYSDVYFSILCNNQEMKTM